MDGWIAGEFLRQAHGARKVMEAMRRAREAQPAWAGLALRERAAVIRSMRDVIVARADDIAAVVSRSTGKTRMDALTTDVFPAVLAASHCLTRHGAVSQRALVLLSRAYDGAVGPVLSVPEPSGSGFQSPIDNRQSEMVLHSYASAACNFPLRSSSHSMKVLAFMKDVGQSC